MSTDGINVPVGEQRPNIYGLINALNLGPASDDVKTILVMLAQGVDVGIDRITSLERWTDVTHLPDAQGLRMADIFQGLAIRIGNLEADAKKLVSDHLQPQLKALGIQVDILRQYIDHNVPVSADEVKIKFQMLEISHHEVVNKMEQFHRDLDRDLKSSFNILDGKFEVLKRHTEGVTGSFVNPSNVNTKSEKFSKSITEFKIISSLSKLGSERKDYRMWQEKLKNAVDQVAIDLREVMDKTEIICWGKAEDKSFLEKEVELKGSIADHRWAEMKRDLYAVLMDKTEGDAIMHVRNQNRNGILSYIRLNKWFTETSGRGLADRRRAIMRPSKVKSEDLMFAAVQKWEDELGDLRKIT
jgi:hypothetical protein